MTQQEQRRATSDNTAAVSIFGLGYVGCVSVACLAKEGHRVIGVDLVDAKVSAIASGFPTVVEPQVDQLIAEGHREGRITATKDAQQAIHATDATIICVGTPTGRDGSLDLSALKATANTIGEALSTKQGGHLVIVRSTVPPGTVEQVLLPAIRNQAGGRADGISVVIIPEFLRESSAVADFYDPPLVIVGTLDGDPDFNQGLIASLMAVEPEEIHWAEFRQAEMMKSLCNVFHALKVAFGNEVGSICEEIGIDGREVMHFLTLDTKLNISPAYLRPGLPFGGSCLPKDLSATIALAQKACVDAPLIRSIRESNEAHKQRAFEKALRTNGYRRIGMDGLAFKTGTDDLRESPMVAIAEFLIGKGYDLRIYDNAVDSARLTGANKDFIQQHIPHLAERLVGTTAELLTHSEALLLTRDDNELLELAAMEPDKPMIVDLTGAGRELVPTKNEKKSAVRA